MIHLLLKNVCYAKTGRGVKEDEKSGITENQDMAWYLFLEGMLPPRITPRIMITQREKRVLEIYEIYLILKSLVEERPRGLTIPTELLKRSGLALCGCGISSVGQSESAIHLALL